MTVEPYVRSVLVRNNKFKQQMAVIAKLLNVNMKTAAANAIPFVGSYTAANTVPWRVIIVPKGGTFATHMSDGTPAFAEITQSAINWNTGNFLYLIDSFTGNPYTIMADSEVPANADKTIAFNGIAAYIETILNGSNEQIWSAVVSGSGGSLKITVTYLAGGSAPNGSAINYYTAGKVVGVDTSNASYTFGDGTDPVADTLYSLQLDGIDAPINLTFVIPSLIYQANVGSSNMGDVFLSTGTWAFPVTIGTADDFFIDIYIMGTAL